MEAASVIVGGAWWRLWSSYSVSRASLDAWRSSLPPVIQPDGKAVSPKDVPFFGPDDPHEVVKVDGVEFKVFTDDKGRKHYQGPAGAVMTTTVDGTPLNAWIDQAEKARAEVMKRESLAEMKRRMQEEKDKARRLGN